MGCIAHPRRYHYWAISLTGIEATQIECKFSLYDCEHVAKDSVCAENGNRQLNLSYDTNGTQTFNDTVLNLRNIAPCGN